jgi:phosphate transport system permease protein
MIDTAPKNTPHKFLLAAETAEGVVMPRASANSWEEALRLLAERSESGEEQPSAYRLICAGETDAALKKKPRREYFANFRVRGGTDRDGDGSEGMPWWGLAHAAKDLADRWRYEEAPPSPGQWVRIRHKEPFTPGSLERRKKIKEAVAKYVFMAMTAALVLPIVAILTHLVVKAWPALSLSFIFQNSDDIRTGGIWAPLVGTFLLVWISLMISAPIGVLAGVYLNEYARNNWFTRLVNLAVVNLAGVPSIVHALFGVGAFVLAAGMDKSLLAASCTVAIMTLPVIIASTREALAAVPMAFREACWNLGATRWQTIRTLVLPNSISGILTGVILQVSRAAGETAPILFTGAALYTSFPYHLDKSFMALSMHLYAICTQIPDVSESIQYGTAVVLIGLVLAVNGISIALRIYLRSRKKW